MTTTELLADEGETSDEESFAPDGRAIEIARSEKASWVSGCLFGLMGVFVKRRAVGRVYPPGTAFRCFSGRSRHIRKPDAAYIRGERLAAELSDKDIAVRPDIVVEVVSPTETVLELDEKIADYRSVGVPLIWVVNPNVRKVEVLRASGTNSTLAETDTLSGEDVLPGFTCKVADFLPPKPAAPSF